MRTSLTFAAALVASSFFVSAHAEPGGDPRAFVEDAIRGDNSEMMLGKLAANRATDPRVRDFGRMLYDDHARAREHAVAVAHDVGASVTERASGVAITEQEKLEQTFGHAFDREFVRYMIADHRNDIAEFRDEAQRGGPAGRLAAETLPDLQKHLDMAEQLSAAS